MDLHHLRCFIVVAEELHFGHAAQKMNMLPSALGRCIKLLEEGLGTRLLTRSTRSVSLTSHGVLLLPEARDLISRADEIEKRFQKLSRYQARKLRIGAIDSAAVRLVPHVLHRFRELWPDVDISFVEDKSSRLLPKLKSGILDLVFIRSPETDNNALESRLLFHENVILAISEKHAFANRTTIDVRDLRDIPLIVPEKHVRPHSYNLTLSLFDNMDFKPKLIQIADEKQTIINMVAAELGAAIMPRWVSRMASTNTRFIEIGEGYDNIRHKLPVSAVWVKGVRDDVRDNMMQVVTDELPFIASQY
ncbi:TPA: LysR family transcriptional regulator [Enterobacter soli]|uniref:LysR family transcriptional regulator n=1 Tax=Enterobacter sp. CP102 TaxID=2976431 RepID=UPI0021FA26AC|nr:LysR family transcriptional regulator [Enterobacter sp. CP102]UWM65866.1 LysR family transcriptional regulator [Enterobacter sp. CP102]HDX4048970.1 LysR family transcriptional regulator [Enterobacter soli]